jgi:hypothetical protein
MRLHIGPTKRHIVRDDGTPFFYLADTAWELFHRLKREEAELYLTRRAEQGFTAIQCVALAEIDGLDDPNPYGEKPLRGNNPARPNDAYFDHVEWVVARGAERGLVMAVLPCWGDKVYPKWNGGPAIFTPENAATYGAYLAKRLGRYPLIWVLGGDRPVETPQHRQTWRAMAAALKSNSPHLVSYHPVGIASSSLYFHNEPWLDFNMIQSGHARRDTPTEVNVLHDLSLQPPKPTIESEVTYEDHPIAWNRDRGWFDDTDVRRAGYRAIFAGAAGYTYGCHNVWQMFEPPRQPIAWARHTWRESLDFPGCNQMRHLRALIERVPWMQMHANPYLASSYGEPSPGARAACLATPDLSHVLLYCPKPVEFGFPNVTLDAYRRFRFRLLDCRSGALTEWAEVKPKCVKFPTSGENDDYVVEMTSTPSPEYIRHW